MIVPPDRRAELREIIDPSGHRADVVRNLETVRMRRNGSVFQLC